MTASRRDRHHHQPKAGELWRAERPAEPDDPKADAAMQAWLERGKWGQADDRAPGSLMASETSRTPTRHWRRH